MCGQRCEEHVHTGRRHVQAVNKLQRSSLFSTNIKLQIRLQGRDSWQCAAPAAFPSSCVHALSQFVHHLTVDCNLQQRDENMKIFWLFWAEILFFYRHNISYLICKRKWLKEAVFRKGDRRSALIGWTDLHPLCSNSNRSITRKISARTRERHESAESLDVLQEGTKKLLFQGLVGQIFVSHSASGAKKMTKQPQISEKLQQQSLFRHEICDFMNTPNSAEDEVCNVQGESCF